MTNADPMRPVAANIGKRPFSFIADFPDGVSKFRFN